MTQAAVLTAAKQSHFPLPVTYKGRTLKREEGRETGRSGVKKSANNASSPPSRPVSWAGREQRQLPGHNAPVRRTARRHTRPGGSRVGGRGARGAPQARQVGARPGCLPPGSAGKADRRSRRAAPFPPGRTKRRETRQGRSAAPEGDKPGPPAPTTPPDRLHLSPATAEGGRETPRRRLRSSKRESGVLTLPAPPAGSANRLAFTGTARRPGGRSRRGPATPPARPHRPPAALPANG